MKRLLLVILGAGLLLIVLVVGLLLYPVVFPYRSSEAQEMRILSDAFEDEGSLYFLLDYRVSRARRPVWFIMPIERSPTVYHRSLALYGFDMDSETLTRLEVLKEDNFPFQFNARRTQFIKTDDVIVFAYRAGWDSEAGPLYAVHHWNPEKRMFAQGGPGATPVPEAAPEYHTHFADYLSPWTDNPGILPVTQLRERLETVPKAAWNLPD